MTKTKETGYAITASNVMDYIKKEYGSNKITMAKVKNVTGVRALLQSDYGKRNDCAITSITALLNYELRGRQSIQKIYDRVEQVAEKYWYNGDTRGTLTITVRSIVQEAGKFFGLTKTAHSRYVKKFGYGWDTLCQQIAAKRPVILCVVDDGRNYYKSHAILAVGVVEYKLLDQNNASVRMVRVYDNWRKEVAFVDFEKLHTLSSIVYLK